MPTKNTERLYRELHDTLHAFVRRRVHAPEDVDDIVQEVFARIHTNSDKLAAADSLSGWIYRVTRNAVADHHRSTAASERAFDRLTHEPFDPRSEDVDLAATAALSRSVRRFLDELPPDSKQALELTDLGGLTQQQAAERLGLSTSGMKSRVQRGRAKLEVLLRECCDIELDARRRVVAFERRKPDQNQ